VTGLTPAGVLDVVPNRASLIPVPCLDAQHVVRAVHRAAFDTVIAFLTHLRSRPSWAENSIDRAMPALLNAALHEPGYDIALLPVAPAKDATDAVRAEYALAILSVAMPYEGRVHAVRQHLARSAGQGRYPLT
jgi:hypothetical protein